VANPPAINFYSFIPRSRVIGLFFAEENTLKKNFPSLRGFRPSSFLHDRLSETGADILYKKNTKPAEMSNLKLRKPRPNKMLWLLLLVSDMIKNCLQ
jgi:hypothetical protein